MEEQPYMGRRITQRALPDYPTARFKGCRVYCRMDEKSFPNQTAR